MRGPSRSGVVGTNIKGNTVLMIAAIGVRALAVLAVIGSMCVIAYKLSWLTPTLPRYLAIVCGIN